MSTLKNHRRALLILVFLLASTLIGCGAKSVESAKIDQLNNTPSIRTATVSEIMLGPGDVLNLSVWQNKELNGAYKIGTDGNIFIPLAGNLQAAGMSAHKLREKIITELTEYIVNPQVQLAVTSYRSRKVYVLGEVRNPGIYQMDDTLTTIVAALSAAGGFTDDANKNSVVHIKEGFDKGNAEVLRIGSYLINDHNHDGHLQNASLSGGDVIYVPSSFMAEVDNFFEHIEKIVRPIVNIERGIILEPLVKDILDGKPVSNTVVVTP